MGKTIKQLHADMRKGGSLARLMTVISIIQKYEKSLKTGETEARDILLEIMKEDVLSVIRYAAYKALCGERKRNEVVRRAVGEFKADPKNDKVITFMGDRS